jgi:hypothetical protein
MLSFRKLCYLLAVDYVGYFVGLTLELRFSAVFQGCFKLSHYRSGQALLAAHEGSKGGQDLHTGGLITVRY